MSENQPEYQKPSKIRLVTNLLGVIVVLLLGWYLFQNREVFSSLAGITPWQIVLMILLEAAGFMLGSYLNYSMIRRFGFHVSYLDSVLLQYSNSFLNKIMPTIGAGAAFRAVFLKKKYSFSYSQFVATLGGLYLISFIATALIGLACMVVFYLQDGLTNWVITLAFLGLLVPCLAIVFFSPNVPERNNRLIKTVRSIIAGWNILKKDWRFVGVYTAFVILQLVLSALQVWVCYQALGTRAGLIPMVFLSTLGIILTFLNFTPDGIGVREAIYVFSANLVQIPQTVLVLGSLVLRGLSIVTSMVFGGVAYWILTQQIKKLG